MTFDWKSIVVTKRRKAMKLQGKSELFQMLAPRNDSVRSTLSPDDGPTDAERMDVALSAVSSFAGFLGWPDTELSSKDCRLLLSLAMEIVDDQPHGLDCPRSRDDFACTCHIGRLYDELSDALDGLK